MYIAHIHKFTEHSKRKPVWASIITPKLACMKYHCKTEPAYWLNTNIYISKALEKEIIPKKIASLLKRYYGGVSQLEMEDIVEIIECYQLPTHSW